MKTTHTLLVLLSLGIAGCSDPSSNDPTDSAIQGLAVKPDSWIAERVEKARVRLNGSEAGKIVWLAMEAHGGLERWYSNGPLSFQFDYAPLDGGPRRNTFQTVDTWSNRTRHQNVDDPSQEFGWTGTTAWKKVTDASAFPFDMKFWATTPYYFLGQPFLFDGAGVLLEKKDDVTFKGRACDVVKVTFEPGTGDAPDDYYVLYFGKDDHKLAVIRYIVSYPEYFKDGGHNPEKLMEIPSTAVVDGVELATAYRTYMLTEDQQAGKHVTNINVSRIAFDPEVRDAYFDSPAGAEVIE